MDSQSLTVLIAVASLVTGVLLCWLFMHSRISAAAAQARTQAQTELAKANERSRLLEQDHQLAVKNGEELKLQAAKSRKALELAQKEQAQLAERASQVPTLETRLQTLQDQQQANQQKLQELQRSAASDAKNTESLKQASARLVALEDENAALKHDVASISASLQAHQARPAPRAAEVTQLPVLEEEVIVLQTLAKTIQQEFQLLAELQRNFTLTSTTVQDFS